MKNFPVRFLLVMVGAAILMDWLVGFVYVEGIGGSGLLPGWGDVEKRELLSRLRAVREWTSLDCIV